MKFQCEKSTLSDSIQKVLRAVSDKSPYSSLEGIKFVLDENRLELTGYDLELGIRTTLEVKSMDKGSFITNARYISEMVKKLDGVLTIEIDSNMMMTIDGGNASYSLNALPADDYPELPGKESSDPISIPQSVLKSMIDETSFAASLLDMKPILKGELFEIENKTLTVAAIDGYRLAVRKEPIGYEGSCSFIVPAKNLNELSKLLSDEDGAVCNIFLSKKHIIFEINDCLVSSRLLEGEFHPYKNAIPDSFKTEAVVERTSLINSLERCLLLVSEKNPSPVRCIFDEGRISIKCRTSSVGRFSDELSVSLTGSPIEIGFKCRYFLDPLKAIGDEKVKLQLGTNLQPMKIVPMEGDSYVYLVLPVRLPKE